MVQGRHTGSCCCPVPPASLAERHKGGVQVTSPVRRSSFEGAPGNNNSGASVFILKKHFLMYIMGYMNMIFNIVSPIKTPKKGTDNDLSLEGMCQVVLYNDDVNSFDHVVESLMVVFGHTVELSVKLAMEAHTSGRTIAEVENASRAIAHKEQLISLGLTAEVERI